MIGLKDRAILRGGLQFTGCWPSVYINDQLSKSLNFSTFPETLNGQTAEKIGLKEVWGLEGQDFEKRVKWACVGFVTKYAT